MRTQNELISTDCAHDYLTTQQAAEYGIASSANAVRILIHRGRLRAFKPNGRLMIKMTDIVAFIESARISKYYDADFQ